MSELTPPCPANLVGGTARRRAGKPLWWRRGGPALPGQASIFPHFPLSAFPLGESEQPSQPFQSGLICACRRVFGPDPAPNLQSQEPPPFSVSSSAMRTASAALGVLDGPKIAMFGSACPGGFKFIKLVTSGSGTDSEAGRRISQFHVGEDGGKAGRIVKHDRFNMASARHNVPEMLFTYSKRNITASPNTRSRGLLSFFLVMPEAAPNWPMSSMPLDIHVSLSLLFLLLFASSKSLRWWATGPGINQHGWWTWSAGWESK